MIQQCKGKDISNIATSKLLPDEWIFSTKYDGNYVQIVKEGDDVKFFTSGNKQFCIEFIAEELKLLNKHDFVIELEYIADTDGKLGSRTKCTTTTFRTNFSKGLPSGAKRGKCNFKLFNQILGDKVVLPESITLVEFHWVTRLRDAKILATKLVKAGWEGLFGYHKMHVNLPGKRVNTAIKIKGRLTADLLCIGYVAGTGKHAGVIGSLKLVDSQGRRVDVGSGLDDSDRTKDFKGKVIEIEYEQILDTYIQPTFLGIRLDKTAKDIS